MKIAISSEGRTLDGAINPRFGRCSYFIILDNETDSYKALENPGQYEGHGAGITAAQFLINEGISAVISGTYGPNAFRTLAAASIKMFSSSGAIRQSIDLFNQQKLPMISQPTSAGHQGMGMGRGSGMGRGQGAGRRRS